jgi:hypothetical protein
MKRRTETPPNSTPDFFSFSPKSVYKNEGV